MGGKTSRTFIAEDSLNAALLNQLECPVCLDTCLPPIMMCQASHIVCSKCYKGVTSCPTCRQPMATQRNYFAEDLCSKVKLPCSNAENGCVEKFNLTDLEVHLPSCSFQNYECIACVTPKCRWAGPQSDLLSHVTTQHSNYLNANPLHRRCTDINKFLNVTSSTTYCELLNADGDLFWVKIINSLDYKTLEFIVLYVGSKESAAKFSFTLEIGRKGSSYLTLPSQTVLVSSDESDGHTFKLSPDYIKLLAFNGELYYKVFISKN